MTKLVDYMCEIMLAPYVYVINIYQGPTVWNLRGGGGGLRGEGGGVDDSIAERYSPQQLDT